MKNLKLKDLLSFPAFYRSRQDSIKSVNIQMTKFFITDENKLRIEGSTDKWQQIIELKDLNLDLNNSVMVKCTCPSFIYEFSHVLNKINSLLEGNVIEYKNPKNKNSFNIPTGCKHLIKLANLILKNSHKINIYLNKIKKE